MVCALLAVAGCGLRLETAGPAPLVPGPREEARARTVADAVLLDEQAEEATASAEPALADVLGQVRTASTEHVTALGGVYDSGLPSPTAAPGTDPTATATAGGTGATAEPELPPASPQDVVDLLAESGAAARADASATDDGELARLLASVAVSRFLLAERLAAVAGLEVPGPPADPAPDPTAAPTDPTAEPPADPAARLVDVPAEVPVGMALSALQALIQSEDAAGLAWEVAAARASDEARDRAAARAREHRERAQAWAVSGELAGTGLDPRRAAYDLPAELTAAPDEAAADAALAELEGDLATTYASLVAGTAAGTRSELVDAVLDAARTRAALDGVVPAFPGLTEA